MRRETSHVSLVLGGLLAVPLSLMALGTLVPQVPFLGVVGSMSLPLAPGFMALCCFAAVAMVTLAVAWGHRRLGVTLLILGVFALVVSLVVTASQIVLARTVGVPITTDMVLRPASVATAPPPDITLPYTVGPDGSPVAMDVYLPDQATVPEEGAPIVMYIHGGGWVSGDPGESGTGLSWLAEQGYVVVSPAYTLATKQLATWDVAMPQIGCALIKVAAHATEWNADSRRIAVFGGSAGGNLALATTYAAAAGSLTPACEGTIPAVAAVGGDVPAVDPRAVHENTDAVFGAATRDMVLSYLGGTPDAFPERLAAVSPLTYAGPSSPPTLIYVSESDHLVPIAGTRGFIERAKAAGTPVQAVFRPWADHTISISALQGATVLYGLVQHFRAHGV